MRSKVDLSTVASVIGEIAGLLASGESVTISIFKNGPEAEFAEVDLIRYRAGDGRQVEEWHNEAAVVAHPGLPWASADFS